MKIRRSLCRLFVVLLVAAGGTLAGSQPAHAGTYHRFFGDDLTGNLFAVDIDPFFFQPDPYTWWVALDVSFISGPTSTSATGCKLTAWLILDKPLSSEWEGPRRTHDCTYDLRRNEWSPPLGFWRGQTSATEAMGRVCVDLYYNYSTSSGWQRCANSAWVGRYD